MICQRCGKCCSFFVLIQTKDRKVLAKPDGVLCPHLKWAGTQAICDVHDEPFFCGSPCDIYGNPKYDVDYLGTENRPCRVGRLIQNNGGLRAVNPDLFEKHIELTDLEDVTTEMP